LFDACLKNEGGFMSPKYSRRDFLKTGVTIGAASMISGARGLTGALAAPARVCVISSANGLRATDKAMEMLRSGGDPLDAVIAGVNIIEEDPNDMSVGYGGLPNEEGVVELDASVMHGPTHSAGAVAALRNIKTPSRVAKLVMERSDHVLLVGDGALKFAKAHGFKEEDLLTDKAREVWLRWKENLSERDNWLAPQIKNNPPGLDTIAWTHGTINCIAIDAKRDLAGVTTTSGLPFKLAGRVGDSPIIGAGLYVDNEIGAAGSTGRGEANILNCGSYTVVEFMARGLSPEEACLKTLERIVKTTKLVPRLLDTEGWPRFGLNFYAINKKGEFGAAGLWSGGKFAVHDGKENRLRDSAFLLKGKG
jgi:N4-(beta-N-acetylglucosaminyl)-L-asparaginase